MHLIKLLIKSLPEVAKETYLALPCGTAINLLVRNIPRLSVDVDLNLLSQSAQGNAFIRLQRDISIF
jgi:Nucleotidyl transferase AbiEii toxin, Type IV TA system